MARKQIMLRDPASGVYRRQPLLSSSSDYSSRRLTVAEFSGGAAAECAAVACCCPCGLVNFLVLFVYKVPAGLCRKALRRKRQQRLLKKGLLPSPRRRGTATCTCTCDESLFHVHPIGSPLAVVDAFESDSDFDNKEVIELEKEMWDKFYGAGFWRSPSQRSAI